MTGGKRLLVGPLFLLLPSLQRGDAFGFSFADRPRTVVGSSERSSTSRVRPPSIYRTRVSPGYAAVRTASGHDCLERRHNLFPIGSVRCCRGMAARIMSFTDYRGSVGSISRPSERRSDFALPEMTWNNIVTTSKAPRTKSSMDINGGASSGQSGLKSLKWIAKPEADSSRGKSSSRQGRSSGGGSSSGGGGSGRGGRRWSEQDGASEGTAAAAAAASRGGNGTAVAWTRASPTSFSLENGVEVDEGVVRRSPLVRTLAPVVGFFRSRVGLYGMMLGYVAFTLSQHITPAYLGVSFLALIGPERARSILVFGSQSLSLLTVASYIQDQFRHQVYPLPAVMAGPSAPYAVITGGSSGIGREIANELAGRGYNLLLVARGKDGLNMAAKELMEASREAVEAAKREQEAGSVNSNSKANARQESRRERKRHPRDQRKERKKRMARRSAQDSEPPVGHPEYSSASSPPVDYGLVPQNVGQNVELKDSSPSPHLSNAITARWFAADLSNSTAPMAVFDEVKRLNISVEILVNSAGICRVGRVDSLEEGDLMAQLQLNVAGTTAITRLFAKEFVRRRRGRIMIVSSITAASPNPMVAVYAASKSYLSSFAEALHSELESYGVGVTCVMPGATRTAFEDNSGSAEALVWRLPVLCMEADEVAARAVEALMRGDRTLIPGRINQLYVHAVGPLIPQKIKMSILEAIWR